MTARAIGLVFIGGIVTTGLSFYFSQTSRIFDEDEKEERLIDPPVDNSFYNEIYDDINEDKVDESPPDFRIIIHGGAGVVSKGIDSKPFFDSLTRIMADAYKYAKVGKENVTALDLAEYCVTLLEDDILFNAGRGAVFTAFETIEMEASIMNGKTLECGAVSLIKTVKHPISLARAVMEHTRHNHLIGKAAEKLAAKCHLDIVDPSYFSTPKRREQLRRAKEMGDAMVNDHDYEDDNIEPDAEDQPLPDPDKPQPQPIAPLTGRPPLPPSGRNMDKEDPNKLWGTGMGIHQGNSRDRNNSENNIMYYNPHSEPPATSKRDIQKQIDTNTPPSEAMDMKPMVNFVVGSLNLPSEKDGIIDLTEGGATAVSSLINDDTESENDSPKISKINDQFKGKVYERNSFNSIEKSREKALEREKEKALEEYYPGSTGTVGCVVMMHGHVAAATSTGGLTNKMAGRVGDTSIIGAGTYANDETCAVSATGKGEEFMRHVAAYDVSARVEIGGMTLEEAVQDTVFKKLPSESGGIIAINRLGEYSMQFNSRGMFRAVCDSYGDCQVGIWEDLIPFQMTPQGDAPIIVTGYSEKMKNEDIEDLVRQ